MQVAMIHHGESPHPSHQGFADALDADWYGLNDFPVAQVSDSIHSEVINGLLVDEYDVYIAEGTRSLYGTLASRLIYDSTIVYLAADQSLYELQYRESDGQSPVNALISEHGMPALEWIFNKFIDGTIANSNFTAEYTRNIINTPLRVAQPYIQPGLYHQLGATDPNLEKDIAVTVGAYEWYKGQDLLPEVWSRVRDEHSSAELYLVGSGYPQRLGDEPGVNVCGYVDDLVEVMASASLYVHPARAESFGVSVVEALRAGLPAVVTSTTGSKSAVRNVEENMIVDCSPESIATEIINYFDRTVEQRQHLSKKARAQGATFDAESRKNTFRREFEQLLSDSHR